MASLLLVLVLSVQGLWLLHTSGMAQWERLNRLTSSAFISHTEVVLDIAAATVEAAEERLRDARRGDAELAAQTTPFLKALGPKAFLETVDNRTAAQGPLPASAFARLSPYKLFRAGQGYETLNLGVVTVNGQSLHYIWKELADAPRGVSRLGVVLPEQVLFQAHGGTEGSYDEGRVEAQVVLLSDDGTVISSDGDSVDKASASDLIRRHALSRTRLIAEVRVSHASLAETWTKQTAPLYTVIFLGTALLIVALLALTRALARHEHDTRELIEVKALAQSAHRSKGVLHAAMSHELSVPLGGIIGTAKLLQRDPHRADTHRLISVILMSARNLQVVVHEILERSKLDAAEARRVLAPTNPAAIGTEVVDLFYASAVAKGIELTFVTPSSPRLVMASGFELRQVLANLVGNAVKQTKRGEVVLSCVATDSSNQAGKVVLRYVVKDTGCGMNASELKKLFTPFFKAQGAADASGQGMGLAIARRLIGAMGGELQVESSEEEGSRFWFEIELDPAASVVCAPEEAAQSLRAVSQQTQRSDARILVVEDNPVSALVTETQLRTLGYRCDVTPDGESALAAMAVGSYDVVLMDCTLPGLSGHDVTQHWREFERQNGIRQPLPIIALTARSMNSFLQQCLDVGMSDFLTKPCTPETLGLTIEKWLRCRDPSTGAQAPLRA